MLWREHQFDRLADVIEQLAAVVDELIEADPDSLSDAALHDVVVGLERQVSRLAAARARLDNAWERRGVWRSDGSKAAGARLARECGLSRSHANSILHRARRLAVMPATRAALAAGDISVDHVELLVAANQPHRTELFARDEATLVKQCSRLRFALLRPVIAYWCDSADNASGVERATREVRGRHLDWATTFGGTLDLQGHWDPISGAIILAELERLEKELFEADWADARARYGPGCSADRLARSPGQRRADALRVMAERSAAMPVDSIIPRPLISVLVGYETFGGMLCELEDGTVLTPGHLLPVLADADIERIVFDGPSRVIDVGARRRFFTGALRRAIELRDRHCQHDAGCDVPAKHCQADHIIPYAQGGLTTQANGELKCGVHNRARVHDHGPDGEIGFTEARRLVLQRLAALPPPCAA